MVKVAKDEDEQEVDNIRQFLEEEGFDEPLMPEDATQGLLIGMGNIVFHVVFAAVTHHIRMHESYTPDKEGREVLECYDKKTGAPRNDTFNTMNGAILNLEIMHIVSGTFLMISIIAKAQSPRNYIHNVLQVAAIPYYHISILLAYFELMHTVATLREYDCKNADLKLVTRKSWVEFELTAFYANILVLVVFLMAQQRWAGGGKKLCNCFSKSSEANIE